MLCLRAITKLFRRRSNMNRDTIAILQVSIAFSFIFTAFNTQGFTLINYLRKIAKSAPETGITESSGYIGFSIIYGVFTFGNLFAPYFVRRFGPRIIQVVGAFLYLTYITSFLYIFAALFYSASALVGLGAAFLWTANADYVNRVSLNGYMGRNSSILWGFIQASMILGGAFLYGFNKLGSSDDDYGLVYRAFAVLNFIGILILAALPSADRINDSALVDLEDPSEDSNEDIMIPPVVEHSILREFALMWNTLISWRMMALILGFAYTGFAVTFYTGVFSACVLSTSALGYAKDYAVSLIAVCIGSGEILGGFINSSSGPNGCLNRKLVSIIGFNLSLVGYLLVYLCLPSDSPMHESTETTVIQPDMTLIGVISVLLGFSDCCWQTQIYVILQKIYKDDIGPAFAIFKIFQSVGACASFYYGSFMTLTVQLVIMSVSGAVGGTMFILSDHRVGMENPHQH